MPSLPESLDPQKGSEQTSEHNDPHVREGERNEQQSDWGHGGEGGSEEERGHFRRSVRNEEGVASLRREGVYLSHALNMRKAVNVRNGWKAVTVGQRAFATSVSDGSPPP